MERKTDLIVRWPNRRGAFAGGHSGRRRATGIPGYAVGWMLLAGMTWFAQQAAAGEPGDNQPITTEESLPEAAGECNLRSTVAYHAGAAEPLTALPRVQLFCGLSRRWGGEVETPMVLAGGRYRPGDTGLAIKYLMRQETLRVPALVLGAETAIVRNTPGDDADKSRRGTEMRVFVAWFKQLRSFSVQGNIGFEREIARNRGYERSYNGAVVLPIGTSRWALIGEVNAASSAEGSVVSFSSGIHFSAGKQSYLAVAFPVSSGYGAARAGVVFQYQTRIKGARE